MNDLSNIYLLIYFIDILRRAQVYFTYTTGGQGGRRKSGRVRNQSNKASATQNSFIAFWHQCGNCALAGHSPGTRGLPPTIVPAAVM